MISEAASTGLLISEIEWAESLAARLRLALSTTADDTPENRATWLEGEIRRELETVPPGRRDSYLDTLQERFPTAARVTGPVTMDGAEPAATREPRTLSELVAWLEKSAANLNADEKRELGARVAALGWSAPTPVEAFDELRQRVGLTTADAIILPRLARLIAQETEVLAKLDQLAWNTWRTIAPRSACKRDVALGEHRAGLRRFLRGDAEPSEVQVVQQMERTRQLIASLIGALSQVSRSFAKRHQDRYAPDAIRELIKMERRKTFFATTEMRCWRKYEELAAEINDATLQTDMHDVVVRYVEDLMRGAPRGAI